MHPDPDDRPNFFVLLGLDPNAPWDDAVFQRELARAQNEWSRLASTGMRNRPKTVQAQRNLNLIPSIVDVMSDASGRDQERERARGLKATELAARGKVAADRLALLLARGYLFDEEAAKLRREFADVLAVDPELAQRLECAPVRPAQPGSGDSRLRPDMEKNLQDLLRTAGAVSLYVVLRRADEGITDHSPLERLRAAAEKLKADVHQIKDKTDPTLTALERLSTNALLMFSSDAERRRHDLSMVIAKLRAIIDEFEVALGVASAVSAAQVEFYLERARRDGVADTDLAMRFLVTHFAARGWIVEMPSAQAEARLASSVQCPRCAQLNEPDNAACGTCGLLLKEPCPNCGKVEPRYGGGCRCGFPTGQRYLVEELLARAEAAIDRHELPQAEIYLGRAAQIWALPPERTDPAAEKLHALRAVLTRERNKIHSLGRDITRLMNERRFVAAVQELEAAPDSLPRRAELLARAVDAVARARQQCEQAGRPGLTSAQPAQRYVEALRVCEDLQQARTELERIPPQPPTRLIATVSDPAAGVQLRWSASADPDVSYVVVRTSGGTPPQTPQVMPGQLVIGTTTAMTFQDHRAAELPGVPLRYAVFAERASTFSAPAIAEPVVVAAEATVDCRAGDRQVVLTWSLPGNAIRAQVTREQIGGSGPVVLDTAEPDRLIDTDVGNGVRYRYTVRVAYPDPDGGLVWSAGSSKDVAPIRPPAPPGPLTVTGSRPELGFSRHRAQIRWPQPDRGSVKVFRQWGVGSLREGDQWPQRRLDLEDGHILDGEPPVTDLWPVTDIWTEGDQTMCSYVPVLVLDGVGYVGAPRRYALAGEPADLHGEFVGDGVRLGWTWPDGVTEALVAYDPARQPVDPTAALGQLAVGRLGQAPTGGCELVAGPDGPMYVTVASTVRHDGVSFVTSGVPLPIDRPGVRIQYEVRTNRLRRPELVLRAATPVDLPALVLRAGRGRLPYTPGDGDAVVTIAAMRLTDRYARALPKPHEPGVSYRLFTASTADTAAVQLDPG